MANRTLERRLTCYPNTKYHRLALAYCNEMQLKKSEFFDMTIRGFFDKNPELVDHLHRKMKQNPDIAVRILKSSEDI